jgi:hypothetical protein
VDEVVAGYLACGLWQGGFARVRCRRCPEEFLVAFSCKRRGVCPSCGAKRAAELAAFLQDEVVEQVGHAQWVFTIPKMLRIDFLHHRELLGALSLAAYKTVKELMVGAVEEKGFRPGMVSVVQTFGEGARFHPHVHALCSRGGWTTSGEWIPLAYVDEGAAEKLFRHKVLALLRRRGLLSEERIELLNSWRRSGFSVHNRVYVHPRDGREFEALVRYMMRPPVSLSRLHFTPGSHQVVYVPKGGHDEPEPAEAERIDAMELRQRRASHRHCRFPPLSRTGPWPGSSSRSRTQDAIWCATTAPTRTPPAASTRRPPPPPSPPLRMRHPRLQRYRTGHSAPRSDADGRS